MKNRKERLFFFLGGVFITHALLAEIIGGKIFSLEGTLGLAPANLSLFGYTMDFNLTAGVILWPFVFILSDIINEYFGREGVQRISFIAAGLIAYSFFCIFIAIHLAPAQWWLDAYKTQAGGNTININEAYKTLLGQGLRIIIGSLTAFLVGQITDVYVFQRIKKITGERWLWLRATGSTFVSQFIDSFLVLFIAFGGVFTSTQILAIGITNYIYKFAIAILLTPVLYVIHGIIEKYLHNFSPSDEQLNKQ